MTIYFKMAQPQIKYIVKTVLFLLYHVVYQCFRVVAPRLRFGCALVAFCYVGCAIRRGYLFLAQPKGLVAHLAQPLNDLNINTLKAKKRGGCAVAPKKYMVF